MGEVRGQSERVAQANVPFSKKDQQVISVGQQENDKSNHMFEMLLYVLGCETWTIVNEDKRD